MSTNETQHKPILVSEGAYEGVPVRSGLGSRTGSTWSCRKASSSP